MAIEYNFKKIKGKIANTNRRNPLDFVNFLYYTYRRNNWMLDIRRFWDDFEDVNIQKPVFLLGPHGGGLTLISRMIRRNNNFVSVTGNCNYWAGADEMATILDSVLPSSFAGVKHEIPESSDLKPPSTWLYANNRNFEHFRKTGEDLNSKAREKFRKIIRWQIARHAINKNKARFVDKSQIYSIRIPLLYKALKDTDPKFILITRNPYALCYRLANSGLISFKQNNLKDYDEKIKVVCEHWSNLTKCALEDGEQVNSLLTIKFEDVLSSPIKKMKEICDFIEIDFDEDLLPQPEHEIPFGSKGRNKWYPLRPEVNEKYFRKITNQEVEIIDDYVGKLADRLNYSKPK